MVNLGIPCLNRSDVAVAGEPGDVVEVEGERELHQQWQRVERTPSTGRDIPLAWRAARIRSPVAGVDTCRTSRWLTRMTEHDSAPITPGAPCREGTLLRCPAPSRR